WVILVKNYIGSSYLGPLVWYLIFKRYPYVEYTPGRLALLRSSRLVSKEDAYAVTPYADARSRCPARRGASRWTASPRVCCRWASPPCPPGDRPAGRPLHPFYPHDSAR